MKTLYILTLSFLLYSCYSRHDSIYLQTTDTKNDSSSIDEPIGLILLDSFNFNRLIDSLTILQLPVISIDDNHTQGKTKVIDFTKYEISKYKNVLLTKVNFNQIIPDWGYVGCDSNLTFEIETNKINLANNENTNWRIIHRNANYVLLEVLPGDSNNYLVTISSDGNFIEAILSGHVQGGTHWHYQRETYISKLIVLTIKDSWYIDSTDDLNYDQLLFQVIKTKYKIDTTGHFENY